MKFKHKNWTLENVVKELEYFKYNSHNGFLYLGGDKRLIFFYAINNEYMVDKWWITCR